MSWKLLLPTFRERERFVADALDAIAGGGAVERMLHLGSGEGDLDPLLAAHARRLDSCDIHAGDVARARRRNAHLANVVYSVEDGTRLSYPDGCFDVVVCLEVLEHVDDPRALLAEIARVLRPGGRLVLTCPSARFPRTYDPINALLERAGTHLPIGAYAYGHTWLVDEAEALRWLAEAGFAPAPARRLSGPVVGLVECYLPGLAQRLLKANADNTAAGGRRARVPVARRTAEPPLVGVVDALIAVDRRVRSSRSVGLGFVLEKPAPTRTAR